MSAYPEGFHAWPLDERNAYFADEARAYDERRKPASAPRLSVLHSPPPPDEYVGPDSPPSGHDGGHEPDVGAAEPPNTADEPLPKLVLLKRVKGRVREWNVRDWIPKRTPTLLQGDGGLGKSTILQQWQSSCATNALWLGLAVEECVTLGVYTEDEAQDVDLRQDAIDDAYGVDCVATGKMHMLAMAGEDAEMVVFDKAGNPSLTKFYRQVVEAALDYHVGASVLTSRSTCTAATKSCAGKSARLCARSAA